LVLGGISAIYCLVILFYGCCLVRTLSQVKSSRNKRKKNANTEGDSNDQPPQQKTSRIMAYLCCCLFCFWDVTSTERLLYGTLLFSIDFGLMSAIAILTAFQTSFNRTLGYRSGTSLLVELLYALSYTVILWLFAPGVNALNPSLKQRAAAEQEERLQQLERDERDQTTRSQSPTQSTPEQLSRHGSKADGEGGSSPVAELTRVSTRSKADAAGGSSLVTRTASHSTATAASRSRSATAQSNAASANKVTAAAASSAVHDDDDVPVIVSD